ncbi:MAG: SMP-30/gluconolactonase/LRE family protein [Cytophagales bacterium]|nr:SMP-30/gluconolactonase/LRE family protein [Cytophagales bacterium]
MKSFYLLLAVVGLTGFAKSEKNFFMQEAQLELDARANLGEGALWHPTENRLYWVDIEDKQVHVYNPETKQNRSLSVGQRVGTIVPMQGRGALVGLQRGIYKLDTQTGKTELLVNPLPDTLLRLNDGKCDPAGRFWVGSLALDSRRRGASLYRFDKDGIHTMLDSVSISNGIVWTSDRKTMYYNDTPTQTVQAFDYDNHTGKISNRRIVITIPRSLGAPDGMAIDAEDKLWVALWGGYGVGRYDPLTGQLMQKITVPAPHVTSCAFGGKNLETLYITTARAWVKPEILDQYPLSGALFSLNSGVRGVPANLFTEPVQKPHKP